MASRVIFLRYEGTMTLSKTVNEALTYLLRVRNYSPLTIDNYQRAFEQFHHFIHSRGLSDEFKHFTDDNLRAFAEALMLKGAKASTVVKMLSALSSIAVTLMKMKDTKGRPYLATNPVKTFDWPQVEHTETKFLLPDELEKFLGVERPLRESLARDILVDTGLRVSELCRVNIGDVIVAGGRVALAVSVKGRGRRLRKLHAPLSAPLAAAVMEWLVSRGVANPQESSHADEPLLLDSHGKRWTRHGLGALVARIGEDAGITRFAVSPHKLRHTANVVGQFAGLDDFTRSKLLGQSSVQSQRVYTHLIPGQLHDARDRQRIGLQAYLGRKDASPEAPGASRIDDLEAPKG